MKEKIKIGYIGLGRRGGSILEYCVSEMKDVEIVAICDTYEPAMKKYRDLLVEKGRPEPIMTTNADDIFNMPEIDAVYIMIGWMGRPEMAIKSTLAGKYTAIEVGCAYDLSECYDLVAASEKSGMPVMMLENCCYDRREMTVLNMVKQNLFGELIHCEGAYGHYLPKEELFKDLDDEYTHYRLKNYAERNCEQYPTHALGPICKVLNINRGNKFLTLNSVASKARGLKDYAKTHLGEDSEYAKIDYKQGDIIDTIITCANGETIHMSLDTTIPRAYYSRNFTVRGTKGLYTDERKVYFLEGMEEEIKDNDEEMFEKYEHPLYKEYMDVGRRGGHGGMDWLVNRAFIEAVKAGTNTPIDVYDTATLLAVGPLSEASIKMGGAPVEFPDFTKGKWMLRPDEVTRCKYCLDEICEDLETPIVPE